jgi:hypothetical protein
VEWLKFLFQNNMVKNDNAKKITALDLSKGFKYYCVIKFKLMPFIMNSLLRMESE